MYTTIIDTKTVQDNLQKPDWRVIDCRFSLTDTQKGRLAYQISHLPNAVYAHLDEDLSAPVIPGKTGRHPLPTPETAADSFSNWGIDTEVQVVIYDDNVGQVASRVWWMLRWLGHDKVAVMDGGWDRWRKEARSETANVPVIERRTFTPQNRPHIIADVDHVNAVKEDSGYRLIDARTEARFRGDVEPIDPVAGHIPGAVCGAFEDNVALDGQWKSQEELRERFRQIIGEVDISHVICYCGSGVSACHNLLGLVHAGLGDAQLYPGSWSEWITDPARSVGRST